MSVVRRLIKCDFVQAFASYCLKVFNSNYFNKGKEITLGYVFLNNRENVYSSTLICKSVFSNLNFNRYSIFCLSSCSSSLYSKAFPTLEEKRSKNNFCTYACKFHEYYPFHSLKYGYKSSNNSVLKVNTSNNFFTLSKTFLNINLNNERSKNINLVTVRHSSSFIRSVMDQVKRDIEANKELKQAVEDFYKSPVVEKSGNLKNKVSDVTGTLKQSAEEVLSKGIETYSSVKQRVQVITNENDTIKKAMDSCVYFSSKVGNAVHAAIDKSQKFIGNMEEEKQGEKDAAEWRKQMAIKRYQKQQKDSTIENENLTCNYTKERVKEEKDKQEEKDEQEEKHYSKKDTSMIIHEESTWDRFGTTLRDMPFLQSFFNNPVLGKLFGETEIASCIRSMKSVDPKFRITDLTEYVEEVVAPHLVESFLLADDDALKVHCCASAYAALHASIEERKNMKVKLDPTILLLKNVELRGARLMNDSSELPWFIFTFSTQQINCLRNFKEEVVQGAIDDIREVIYSIAITRHPQPDIEGLHHPWMIKEVAIIGNTPVW